MPLQLSQELLHAQDVVIRILTKEQDVLNAVNSG